MALNKIKKDSITADAIDATKVADDAISEEHLDKSVITDQTSLAEAANAADELLIYDTSAAALKRITASNVGTQAITISAVSPTNVQSGDGTGNHTFTITGTNFGSAAATLVNASGAEVDFDSVTVNSATQITGVIAKSSLPNSGEPYDVRVFGSNGLQATLRNQINVNASPIFNTASGSLGSFTEQTTITTIDIEAQDPESAGNVSFEFQSGSLPAGLSSTTVNENGVSKFRITGTLTAARSSFTTTTFVLRAVDAASNTSSRSFSISEIPSAIESFTSDGTFTVPTGVTSANVLVVAGGGSGGADNGGGGGGGGLIYVPNFPLTPGATMPVSVGCGGPAVTTGSQTQASCRPGDDSSFGGLTAKGGGFGRGGVNTLSGGPGGSGGGGTGHGSQGNTGSCSPGGPATQPTQPGQSGAYGFGNAGGKGRRAPGGQRSGGGGGGAGAVGGQATCTGAGAQGGAGKAYTIADGTTSVYYSGGGGGGGCVSGGEGGQGGGGDSNAPGTANRGGGAGGGDNNTAAAVAGKGVVIISY